MAKARSPAARRRLELAVFGIALLIIAAVLSMLVLEIRSQSEGSEETPPGTVLDTQGRPSATTTNGLPAPRG